MTVRYRRFGILLHPSSQRFKARAHRQGVLSHSKSIWIISPSCSHSVVFQSTCTQLVERIPLAKEAASRSR